ncbi:SMI1/KNR4 family protein [Bacillus sp. FSL W7-1360]
MINAVIKNLKEQLNKEFEPFLNPPATEGQIRHAEKEMGIIFPEDLRSLYLIHNGENESGPGLFFGLPFLSLDDMLDEWRGWPNAEEEWMTEIDSHSVPSGWIKERYVNRYWIPISKDHGGNHIGIDLDPDEKGHKGQIINFGSDEEVKYVIAHQIVDLLSFITETLRKGNYTLRHEEEEEGDYVHWDYGSDGESTHFLDELSSLELPLLCTDSLKK